MQASTQTSGTPERLALWRTDKDADALGALLKAQRDRAFAPVDVDGAEVHRPIVVTEAIGVFLFHATEAALVERRAGEVVQRVSRRVGVRIDA